GDPGGDRGLPRGDLTGTRADHLPQHDVVDLVGGDGRTRERLADRDRPEIDRRHPGEGASELPDRRSSTRNDDGRSHLKPSVGYGGSSLAGAYPEPGEPRARGGSDAEVRRLDRPVGDRPLR